MADKTIKELLADYNAVAVQAGVPKLKGWKGSGAKLGQRTAMLRARPRKVAGAAKGNGKQAKVPIYVRTCELLCEVTHVEDKRKPSGPDNVKRKGSLPPGQERSVGMSYGDVLKKVRRDYKGCSTSMSCVRWYAVKIRAGEQGYDKYKLPQRRPRTDPE